MPFHVDLNQCCMCAPGVRSLLEQVVTQGGRVGLVACTQSQPRLALGTWVVQQVPQEVRQNCMMLQAQDEEEGSIDQVRR